MFDPFDLDRFVIAQEMTYEVALSELRRGEKRTHWIWFIFPQFAGLGSSARSQRFAIRTAAEAAAYWNHPLLGARLRECLMALLSHPERTAREILGEPDDAKVRSCATLFHVVSHDPLCARVLEHFYSSAPDAVTLRLVGAAGAA